MRISEFFLNAFTEFSKFSDKDNIVLNKEVLLRERKRHTARRVASARYGGGGTPSTHGGGGTPLTHGGGYPVHSWRGVPHPVMGGYPIQS